MPLATTWSQQNLMHHDVGTCAFDMTKTRLYIVRCNGSMLRICEPHLCLYGCVNGHVCVQDFAYLTNLGTVCHAA